MTPVHVVERTLKVLTSVARTGAAGVTLSALASSTSLSASTLHRHISTLTESGYLWRDPTSKLIYLGGQAAALGAVWNDTMFAQRHIGDAVLQLKDEIGETAFASQLAGREIVCVAMQRGTSPLHLSVRLGQSIPLRHAASARVVLAYMNDAEVLALLNAEEPSQGESKLEDELFLEQLASIRKQGFDTCENELDVGVFAIACPIRGPDMSSVFGALAIAGPIDRFSSEAARSEAIEATLTISAQLSELGASDALPAR